MEEVLTVEQAAERINMSVRYVRRLVAERRIPFHKLGRSVRIMASDLDAYVQAGRVEPITASLVWTGLRSVA
jgi:excisionase family DNA binding protein